MTLMLLSLLLHVLFYNSLSITITINHCRQYYRVLLRYQLTGGGVTVSVSNECLASVQLPSGPPPPPPPSRHWPHSWQAVRGHTVSWWGQPPQLTSADLLPLTARPTRRRGVGRWPKGGGGGESSARPSQQPVFTGSLTIKMINYHQCRPPFNNNPSVLRCDPGCRRIRTLHWGVITKLR